MVDIVGMGDEPEEKGKKKKRKPRKRKSKKQQPPKEPQQPAPEQVPAEPKPEPKEPEPATPKYIPPEPAPKAPEPEPATPKYIPPEPAPKAPEPGKKEAAPDYVAPKPKEEPQKAPEQVPAKPKDAPKAPEPKQPDPVPAEPKKDAGSETEVAPAGEQITQILEAKKRWADETNWKQTEDLTGESINGSKLEKKLGYGGMGAVYLFHQTTAKALENSKLHEHFNAIELLWNYVYNGLIELSKVGVEGYKEGLTPEQRMIVVHRTPGLLDELWTDVRRKGDKSAMQILGDKELADIVSSGAMKISPPHEEMKKRSRREAEVQRRAPHLNLIAEFFSGSAENRVYIGLEYIDHVMHLDKLKEPMQAEIAFQIGCTVLEFLAHLASLEVGVAHRDIKPANIMIKRMPCLTKGGIILPNGYGVVKGGDLGLAKYLNRKETKLSETGAFHGTPYYTPPERSEYQISKPSGDVWSLAATLYDMVAGRVPFGGEGDSPFTIVRKIVSASYKNDPAFPSNLRIAVGKSKLPPKLESLILEMLVKGTKEFYQRIHEIEDIEAVEYREARPGPEAFLKKAQVVVDRMPGLYAGVTAEERKVLEEAGVDVSEIKEMSTDERQRMIREAFDLPTELTDADKAVAEKLKAEIQDALEKRDAIIKKGGEALSNLQDRYKVFAQELRVSSANYALADLVPVSVEKEVDSPDGPRFTKAVYLERGIDHHNHAVELIKRIWVDDIYKYLKENIGEDNVKKTATKMRSFRHVDEKEAVGDDLRKDQAVRLLEILLVREFYIDEADEIKNDIIKYAGERAAYYLGVSREKFVEFKGGRAYATFIDRVRGMNGHGGSKKDAAIEGLIKDRGEEALAALNKSKEAFVKLCGENEYAKLIGSEEDAHSKLVAKLKDEAEQEKFVREQGSAYLERLSKPGKERDEYKKVEGEVALSVYFHKYKIDGKKSPDAAYEELKAKVAGDKAVGSDFREIEGKIVLHGLMDRIHNCSRSIELDELTAREEELAFQKWLDIVLGRDPITKKSTTVNIEDRLEGEVDEDFISMIEQHLSHIADGYKDSRSRDIPGYIKLLKELGSSPTLDQVLELQQRMDQYRIPKRLRKLSTHITAIEEYVEEEEGIADSALPMFEEVRRQRDTLKIGVKIPDHLCDLALVDNEAKLRGEVAEMEPEVTPEYRKRVEDSLTARERRARLRHAKQKAETWEKVKDSWHEEIRDVKRMLTKSADTIEREYINDEKQCTPEVKPYAESYVAALRVYASHPVGQDAEALKQVGKTLNEFALKQAIDLRGSTELHGKICELTKAIRYGTLRTNLKRLERVLAIAQKDVGPDAGREDVIAQAKTTLREKLSTAYSALRLDSISVRYIPEEGNGKS
ncbi:protein kinase [Candidatus Woesearchaeota archaeon]|nr:protein kinase [Candidatus Woesearchaeota archaeon]